MNIEFIFAESEGATEFFPVTAKTKVPDWYKKTKPYIFDKKVPLDEGPTPATIKRCMPIFDALTFGYLLLLETDLFIEKRDGHFWYRWPAHTLVEFHPHTQAEIYPRNPKTKDNEPFPKIVNKWGIKTPTGYSCLFTAPIHRDNVLQILPGVVDTDKYNLPVSFPFQVTDENYSGIIPAGTPYAQVIPFKRENWNSHVVEDTKHLKKQTSLLSREFFDRYKGIFRQQKTFN